ncbi:MAG: hypothetical protein JXA42_25485 [Anaerolineales bacterium]|nr:hypothetical protein [Anaerolineales bacterium]
MITSVASLLWLVVALFYIFETCSVTWFGRIAWLDNGFFQGAGIISSVAGLVVGVAGEVTLGRGGWIGHRTSQSISKFTLERLSKHDRPRPWSRQ